MGVKIAVVGGGSTYTPELVEGFEARRDRMPIDELVLLDTDPRRLEIVGGLAQRMLDRLDWTGRLRCTGDREAAIDGADFVLIQLRVGGQAARLVDETLPPTFGVVGQETTGAGGFAKALRTVPVVLELAELTAKRGAPGAWIVDFTNPVGIVSQALLDAGHRAIGLCNVAINIQRGMAERFGVSPGPRRAGARRAQPPELGAGGPRRRRGPPARAHRRRRRRARRDGRRARPSWSAPSARSRRTTSTTTTRRGQVVEDQRAGHTRAQEVIDIESQLLDLYQDQGLAEKPALLSTRGGAYYSEAAAQLIASLHDGAGDVQVVDVRNDGALPGLPDAAVVEIPARIDRDGAHPLPLAPLSTDMLGLVEAVKAYEMLAIEAATDRRPADGPAGAAREPARRRLRHRGAAARRAARGQPGAPAAVLRVAVSRPRGRPARP